MYNLEWCISCQSRSHSNGPGYFSANVFSANTLSVHSHMLGLSRRRCSTEKNRLLSRCVCLVGDKGERVCVYVYVCVCVSFGGWRIPVWVWSVQVSVFFREIQKEGRLKWNTGKRRVPQRKRKEELHVREYERQKCERAIWGVQRSRRGKESTRERVMESVREADGDEGLGRVAKPLRKRKKKDENPLHSLCRKTGNQGRG